MSEPLRRDIRGIVGCVVLIVAGALALTYSREFSALGAVFPRTVAAAMILLSVVYIAVAVMRPAAPRAQQEGSVWRRLALVAVMVAWAVLLETVGFLTTSIVAYAALLVIANYDRWTPRTAVAYVGVGAAVLGGLYAIFRFGLQVPLPPGALI